MANQYDAVVIKAGIPSAANVAGDVVRADRAATAGFTTSSVAAGDACQVSGTYTLIKALVASTSAVVGIFDGITGALVSRGVVVATFAAGPSVAGEVAYLSSTAGQLTTTKPTSGLVHEVGIVVDPSAKTILLQPKPVVALG